MTQAIDASPEVETKLRDLIAADPILKDTRNHTPVEVERRRAALHTLAIAHVAADETSALALERKKRQVEIEAFVATARAEYDPVLAEIEQRKDTAEQNKIAALARLREAQAAIREADAQITQATEDRQQTAALLALTFARAKWSKEAVPHWDGAIDALEQVCAQMALSRNVAVNALRHYLTNGGIGQARRPRGFAAVVDVPLLADGTGRALAEPNAKRRR